MGDTVNNKKKRGPTYFGGRGKFLWSKGVISEEGRRKKKKILKGKRMGDGGCLLR